MDLSQEEQKFYAAHKFASSYNTSEFLDKRGAYERMRRDEHVDHSTKLKDLTFAAELLKGVLANIDEILGFPEPFA